MTDRNELVEEMRGGWLDTDTLDRMLAGGIDPDDAPPGYSEVARVLLVVAEAEDGRDLAHEAAHVALAMELVQQRSPVPHSLDRRSRRPSAGTRSRSHRGKIGALILVGAMVGSTGLAAAGVLPDAAQDAFAHVLDKVGITVPGGRTDPASSAEESPGTAAARDARGAHNGAETSSAASSGRSQAGKHRTAGTTGGAHGAPPVHTPNGGRSGTANATGKRGSGTGKGDVASHRRSDAGSGNGSGTPPVHPRPSEPPAHSSH